MIFIYFSIIFPNSFYKISCFQILPISRYFSSHLFNKYWIHFLHNKYYPELHQENIKSFKHEFIPWLVELQLNPKLSKKRRKLRGFAFQFLSLHFFEQKTFSTKMEFLIQLLRNTKMHKIWRCVKRTTPLFLDVMHFNCLQILIHLEFRDCKVSLVTYLTHRNHAYFDYLYIIQITLMQIEIFPPEIVHISPMNIWTNLIS